MTSKGLDALVPLVAYARTAQGYGVIETTPAYWGLSWISPELLVGYTSAESERNFFGRVLPMKDDVRLGVDRVVAGA